VNGCKWVDLSSILMRRESISTLASHQAYSVVRTGDASVGYEVLSRSNL
jgi:hypothetical protein